MDVVGLVLIIIVALIALLELLDRIPAKFRNLDTPTLRDLLQAVYVRGKHQAYLHIYASDSKRYIRVCKSIIRENNVALEARIPANALKAAGVSTLAGDLVGYGIAQIAWQSDGNREFAIIHFGSDLQRAVVLTEFLIARVLKDTSHNRAVGYVKGLARNPKAHPGFDEPLSMES